MEADQEPADRWRGLCGDHDSAMRDYLGVLAPVITKMTEVFKGSNAAGPTIDELNAAQRAKARWDDAERRMDAFCREHTSR